MDGDASLTTKVKKKVTTKKKKKKKVVLSASERRDKKIKSDHRQLVRAVFSMTGFERINKLSDKEFDFKGQRSDFDDVFVYENIVVCAEYTTTSSVSSHLKPKKIVYDKIDLDHGDFLDHLRSMSSEFTNSDIHKYANEEIILRILYCSLHSVDSQLKLNVDNPIYFDYPVLRYFQNLTNTIRVSARPELFDFLDIPHSALGRDGKIFPDSGARDFHGGFCWSLHRLPVVQLLSGASIHGRCWLFSIRWRTRHYCCVSSSRVGTRYHGRCICNGDPVSNSAGRLLQIAWPTYFPHGTDSSPL